MISFVFLTMHSLLSVVMPWEFFVLFAQTPQSMYCFNPCIVHVFGVDWLRG